MLKLTYFPAPGNDAHKSKYTRLNKASSIACILIRIGRAYVIRTCLKIANVPFEDEKITFSELKERRGEAGRSSAIPLGSVPVLTFPDGRVVTQSMAIARYAGKLANLYPTDPEKALFVDEILDTVAEIVSSAPQNADADIKKKLREEYAAGKLNTFYSFLDEKLSASGGLYYFGELSIADIAVYGVLKGLRTGNFDYIPGDYDSKWPQFQAFIENLESNPVFAPHKL